MREALFLIFISLIGQCIDLDTQVHSKDFREILKYSELNSSMLSANVVSKSIVENAFLVNHKNNCYYVMNSSNSANTDLKLMLKHKANYRKPTNIIPALGLNLCFLN